MTISALMSIGKLCREHDLATADGSFMTAEQQRTEKCPSAPRSEPRGARAARGSQHAVGRRAGTRPTSERKPGNDPETAERRRGYALGIHGVIRATGDIDFLYRLERRTQKTCGGSPLGRRGRSADIFRVVGCGKHLMTGAGLEPRDLRMTRANTHCRASIVDHHYVMSPKVLRKQHLVGDVLRFGEDRRVTGLVGVPKPANALASLETVRCDPLLDS